MLDDSFQQLEAPERYYNRNGVSFGYVVRVRGLNRSLYLNDIGKVQDDLMVQTPMHTNSGMFYLTTALFSSEHVAYESAAAFYRKHECEYDYVLVTGGWRIRPDITFEQYSVETVESQIMEFE